MERLEMTQEGLAAFVIFTLEQAATSLEEFFIIFIGFARRFSFFTACGASGRFTSRPDSFTNEAVTMKKMSMMNTTSSIGVRFISASSSGCA